MICCLSAKKHCDTQHYVHKVIPASFRVNRMFCCCPIVGQLRAILVFANCTRNLDKRLKDQSTLKLMVKE